MLTFALCVIAFFIGIAFAIWYFFGIISSMFSKISDGFGMMYDTWCDESKQPKLEPEVINIDVRSVADTMIFYINFAVDKAEEFILKNKEREAELKRKQDAHDARNQWEERIKEMEEDENAAYRKDWSESLKNPEGILEESLKNPEGIPAESLQESLDNQGIPVNEELIEDSKKSTSNVWESSL